MPARGVSEVGLCCGRLSGYTLLEDYRCMAYGLNLFRDRGLLLRGVGLNLGA